MAASQDAGRSFTILDPRPKALTTRTCASTRRRWTGRYRGVACTTGGCVRPAPTGTTIPTGQTHSASRCQIQAG